MSGDEHDLDSDTTAAYWIVSVILVLGAGVFSGLNLAMFAIDPMKLRVQQSVGTETERRQADRLLPLLERQHLTLVALLVSNASFMTALPIFLERVLDPATALVVSVTAVLFFGEVIPQATFVRNALPVCSFLSPLIWVLIGVTFPVTYPFAKILDAIVGHKEEVMEKDQLGEFFKLHGDHPDVENKLSPAEVAIMRGAMSLSSTLVKSILKVTPEKIFMLSSVAVLDKPTLERLMLAGYSRIPVYKDNNTKHLMGALLVKSLLPLVYTCPVDPPRVGDYHLLDVLHLSEEATMYDAYEAFQTGQSNMAAVYSMKGAFTGIITLEDVFETLHSITITDETDLTNANPVQIDVRQKQMLELLQSCKGETNRSFSRSPQLQ
jgi:ankyrin repeat/SOCS box protein 13/metal transporter CNNM